MNTRRLTLESILLSALGTNDATLGGLVQSLVGSKRLLQTTRVAVVELATGKPCSIEVRSDREDPDSGDGIVGLHIG